MMLEATVRKHLGSFTLEVDLASPGGITALFGRSGAGKTSVVNIIAGLLKPDAGRVSVDGAALTDTAARVHVPPHKRGVGYVFQEGRLFPHLSVRGNLEYGRRFARDRDRWGSLDEVVALLDIAPLLDRRPADLSGGEKQRVAIGRALLASPRLLLMDEPLASLDAPRKEEILPYIERLRDKKKLPIVYVSHAMEEVTRLADTVVLMDAGRVVASGGVNDVFGRMDLRAYTGAFEASTVLHARIVAHDDAAGITLLEHAAGRLSVSRLRGSVGDSVRLRIRARDVVLATGDPGRISVRNRLPGTVVEMVAGEGPAVDVKIEADGTPLIARVTRAAVNDLGLEVGRPVVALIKSTAFDRPDDSA
jgi:molybdate transport system ATP-binding protein